MTVQEAKKATIKQLSPKLYKKPAVSEGLCTCEQHNTQQRRKLTSVWVKNEGVWEKEKKVGSSQHHEPRQLKQFYNSEGNEKTAQDTGRNYYKLRSKK